MKKKTNEKNEFEIIENKQDDLPQYEEKSQFAKNIQNTEIEKTDETLQYNNLPQYTDNNQESSQTDTSIIQNNKQNEFQPINNDSLNNFQTIDNFDQSNTNDFTYVEEKESNFNIKKVLIIIGGIILLAGLIFLIYYLITNSNKLNKYNNLLVTATKNYYENNGNEMPVSYGQCNIVTLNTLIQNKLITDNTLTNKCDQTTTNVKVCKLSDNSYHYTPTLSCNNKLNTTYNDWLLGSEKDLISNTSDVQFKFAISATELPEDLSSIPNEDYIEDEIPFEEWTYEEINKKVVYHSRDQLYNWYTLTNYYYPNNVTIESKVNEYYLTAPNSTYKNKGGSAIVYKWYIGLNQVYNNGAYVSESVYPYIVKGTEGTAKIWATTDFPETKSYRTIVSDYIYRTRKLESTDVLTDTDYYCINDSNGNKWISHNVNCNDSLSGEVGTVRAYQYKCYWTNDKTDVSTQSETWQSYMCTDKHYYVNESVNEGYTTTWSHINCEYDADARPYLCDRRMGYVATDKVWKWYTPSTKEYYKSNGETTYYKLSPSAQAVKDSATEATGYTWYKQVTNNLGASKASPSSGALRGSKTWGEWSAWVENPITATDTLQVEQKNMITLKRLITDDTKWVDITDNYVSEQEAISILQNKGYKVNSVEDIFNAKNIKYEVELYYRNPK